MKAIKRNTKGKVLFSSVRAAVSAERLDELNGYTFEIEAPGGPRVPDEFIIDKSSKRVVMKTSHVEE